MPSDIQPSSQTPDLFLVHLSRHVYMDLVHTLLTLLPPPPDPSPQALHDRNLAAIAKIADHRPINALELDFAATYVINRAQADDALRQIRNLDGDLKTYSRLQSNYNALIRGALSAEGHLRRTQAVRRAREPDANPSNADAWAYHIALTELRRALDILAPAPEEPAPPPALEPSCPPLETSRLTLEPAQPMPTARQPDPPAAVIAIPVAAGRSGAVAPRGRSAPAQPAAPPVASEQDEPSRDLVAEAEHYAVIYPRRADVIRRHGGLPPDCDFGPPDDDLVQAIVAGSGHASQHLALG